jgi:YD repeat-containing protein
MYGGGWQYSGEESPRLVEAQRFLPNSGAAVEMLAEQAENDGRIWATLRTVRAAENSHDEHDLVQRLVTVLFATDPWTYGFDANGKQIQEASATGGRPITNVYDKEDRLVQINNGGQLSTFTYDGDGQRRTAHPRGKSSTTSVWDGTDYLGEI